MQSNTCPLNRGASPWTGISQCHVTRAGWKSGSPIPLNFPQVFSKLSWAAIGEARRRTTPKVLGGTVIRCFQGHVRPISALLSSGAMVSTTSSSCGCIIFFPSCFQSSRFFLPTSSFPGQPGAISLGYQEAFNPMSALFLSPHNNPSQQFNVSSLTATSLLWSSASCCSKSSPSHRACSPHHIVLPISEHFSSCPSLPATSCSS